MLEIKFFQINGNHYAKARHNGIVVDTASFSNVDMQIAAYIKTVRTWGYAADEIKFIIDPTCAEYEQIVINRALEIY